MKKRILALALVLALVLSLAACGASNTQSSASPSSAPSTSAPSASASASAPVDQGPPVELTYAVMIGTGVPKDIQLVQDKINEYLKEKINATVKIVALDPGSWAQQVKLMLTGNEPLDVLTTGNIPGLMDYMGQVSRNQLMPLNDLLDKYGQGVKDAVPPEILQASTVNGKIYGIPTVRDWGTKYGIELVTDFLKKSNIDPSSIKSVDDLTAVFDTLKKANPDMSVISNWSTGNTITEYLRSPVDNLADGIGVLLNGGDNLKVVNYYETAEYASMLNTVRGWYEAGYILPDAATTTQQGSDLYKAGRVMGWPGTIKPGQEKTDSAMTGTDLSLIPLTGVYNSTFNTTTFMMSMTSYTKNPDKAMQFINLMYSDPVLINLFCYGIEGTHYAKQADGTIDFAPGVTPQTSGYAPYMSFEFGNQSLAYLWKGEDLDHWKQMDEFNKSAYQSKAMGFLFDSAPVKTQWMAVQNVINQYRPSLEVGAVDPAKVLPEFIEKLKAAGIDDIIKEKQTQLDNWAKTNGVS